MKHEWFNQQITNKHSPHILGATLAHELAHHFLVNKGIYYPDVAENERMTDFATVFLGLGKLTLIGYNPMQWSVRRGDKIINYSYKVGYLSSQEIADAMVHVCAFRSIPLSEIKAKINNFKPNSAWRRATSQELGHVQIAIRQRVAEADYSARSSNGFSRLKPHRTESFMLKESALV
jgi:hypothetical protein